jgi:hypothetical protein
MSTTITYGGQSATFDHPRELHFRGPPDPPRQPIASWAATLAHFEALCNADQFEEALRWLHAEHVIATTADVPSGKLAAFKAYVASRFGTAVLVGPPNAGLPPYLSTASGANWRA